MKLNIYRNLYVVSFITILAICCTQSKPKQLVIEKQKIDSVGTIYHFDTTQFTNHKLGFYISRTGNVFQCNSLAYDDSTGFWSTHYWLDSLMFFGEYPNKKPLKEVINLETFVSDSLSRYDQDKNNVYYTRSTSDGV